MGWWIPAMMAAGMLKNELIDKPEQQRAQRAQSEMAATQTEYSGLTGNGAGSFKVAPEKSTVGAGMKWGMMGAQMGQGMGGAGDKMQATDAGTTMSDNYQPQRQPDIWRPNDPMLQDPRFQNPNRRTG